MQKKTIKKQMIAKMIKLVIARLNRMSGVSSKLGAKEQNKTHHTCFQCYSLCCFLQTSDRLFFIAKNGSYGIIET